MTNNLDLVRDLLFRGEEEGFSSEDPKTVYHIRLLKQAGLVQAVVTPKRWKGRFTLGILKRLTPAGRQFLQAARNEMIWRRTKKDFIRPGLFFSLSLVADYLRQQDKLIAAGNFASEKS